jgi:hypothetical protein
MRITRIAVIAAAMVVSVAALAADEMAPRRLDRARCTIEVPKIWQQVELPDVEGVRFSNGKDDFEFTVRFFHDRIDLGSQEQRYKDLAKEQKWKIHTVKREVILDCPSVRAECDVPWQGGKRTLRYLGVTLDKPHGTWQVEYREPRGDFSKTLFEKVLATLKVDEADGPKKEAIKEAPPKDPKVAGAKEAFEKFVRLSQACDPAVAGAYSDAAKIAITAIYPDGTKKEMALSGVQAKAIIPQAVAEAKRKGDIDDFSEVTYAVEGEHVRVKAKKFNRLKKYTAPVEFLFGPERGEWKIFEEVNQSLLDAPAATPPAGGTGGPKK